MTLQEFVPRRSGPLLRVGKEKACVPEGLKDHARVGREKQPGWQHLRPPKKSAKKSARLHPPRSCLSPECGHPNQPMTSPPTGRQRRGLRKACSLLGTLSNWVLATLHPEDQQELLCHLFEGQWLKSTNFNKLAHCFGGYTLHRP